MPELPEVETIRRQLAPMLAGRRVTEAASFPHPKFSDATAAVGWRVGDLRRRGKYLIADLGDGVVRSDSSTRRELVVHLGMTGRLEVLAAVDPSLELTHPHLRAWWELDDGTVLTFHDARRFGRIAVVDEGDHSGLPTLAALGPEPFSEDFTPASLRAGLRGRRAVKTALLSQRVVAGVGNIYADEALWLAGVHPRVRRLGDARAAELHGAIREVLAAGLSGGGTTLRDYRDARGAAGTHQSRLHCYGRAGQECDRCAAVLRGGVLDGRGTTWCPGCQH